MQKWEDNSPFSWSKSKSHPHIGCEDDSFIIIECLLLHHFSCGSVTHFEDVTSLLPSNKAAGQKPHL